MIHFFHCTNHLIPASIIDCNLKIQSIIFCRSCFQLHDLFLEPGTQTCGIPDHAYTHIIFICCFNTVLQITFQQLHECCHLSLRSVPVFCRKSIHSQIFNSHIMCCFADCFHIFCPNRMTIVSGHSLTFCPSSVPVKDNCYMLRNFHCNHHAFP